MKKTFLLIIVLALLMCGCAPAGLATSEGLDASSPAAGPATPEPSETPEPMSEDIKALLGINEEIWEEKHMRNWMIGRLIIPDADINVAVFIHGKWATIVNVGDSRAYFIDQVGIHQVTVDHSVVQLMVSRGELTPEQAKTYPGKSLITRAIGTESMVACDIFHKKVSDGDYFLLCSDGLSNLMDDQEILFEVAHGQDKDKCCQRLLDIAKKRGAPDNVTSVLVAI